MATEKHAPIQDEWKVVTATHNSVVVVSMCECGSDWCAWTATAGSESFVNQRADGTNH